MRTIAYAPLRGLHTPHRGRYLWTDAFSVVDFVTLSREKVGAHSRPLYLELARRFADAVHSVLGRTWDGSPRLPGATDEEPLKGGLRIGKLDGDGPDGDGQDHHCLTLWMFALNRLALATGETSIDMRQTLVNSKGNLDDVNGFVIFQLLQDATNVFNKENENTTVTTNGAEKPPTSLSAEIEQYQRILASHPKTLSGDPPRPGHEPVDPATRRGRRRSRRRLGAPSRRASGRPTGSRSGSSARASASIQCYEENEVGDGDGYAAVRLGPLHAGEQVVLDAWEGKVLECADEDLPPINSAAMYAAALVPGGDSIRLFTILVLESAFCHGFVSLASSRLRD
ncbi:hypothetical protein Hte_011019 [Hypoxylon texense]